MNDSIKLPADDSGDDLDTMLFVEEDIVEINEPCARTPRSGRTRRGSISVFA